MIALQPLCRARRWRRERIDRVTREDVRDLESMRDIGSLSLLGGLIAAAVRETGLGRGVICSIRWSAHRADSQTSRPD